MTIIHTSKTYALQQRERQKIKVQFCDKDHITNLFMKVALAKSFKMYYPKPLSLVIFPSRFIQKFIIFF